MLYTLINTLLKLYNSADIQRLSLSLCSKYRKTLLYSVLLLFGISSLKLPARNKGITNSNKKESTSGRVDLKFVKKLFVILKILLPRTNLRAWSLISAHTLFLICRTLISLKVADLDGVIVSKLISRDYKAFLKFIGQWLILAVPATICNSSMAYLQEKIALYYRVKLSGYITRNYLKNNTFYILSNIDKSVSNFDRLVTFEVTQFSNILSGIFGNLGKPALDILIYSWRMAKDIGKETVLISTIVLNLTATLLNKVTPPFGKYVAQEAHLEGVFSSLHSRLIEFNEPIALQRGHFTERDNLDQAYYTLEHHVKRTLKRRFWQSMLKDFITKYLWGSFGILITAVPIFYSQNITHSLDDRVHTFFRNRKLLIYFSDAVDRLFSTATQISYLAGYTGRLSKLISSVDQNNLSQNSIIDLWQKNGKREFKHSGRTEVANYIEFDGVPIISPNGTVLIGSLNFKFLPGQHLLLVGPNGSGKSSLFRVLGGLWPVLNGTLKRPKASDLFYVPQAVYMFSGSLRDQVIYPQDIEEMKKFGKNDEDLDFICKDLNCTEMINRLGGWNAENDWKDSLSVGDQQLIAAIRLLYHNPKYAILDECSSELTLKTEGLIYEEAEKRGITLMTVSHRSSLYKYHRFILAFDGKGGYYYGEFDWQKRVRLEEERQKIELAISKLEPVQNDGVFLN